MPVAWLMSQWDDQAALARIEAARWGATPTCPKCGATRVSRKTEAYRLGRWRCYGCRASFTALAGTALQGTRAPLSLWVYLAEAHARQERVNTAALGRAIGLPQPTVWRVRDRVVKGMTGGDPLLCALTKGVTV